MLKKNRLKEIILAICEKKDRKLKNPRAKKSKPMYELQALAEHLGVSFKTVFNWYSNKHQPRGGTGLEFELAQYFNKKWKEFYYYE